MRRLAYVLAAILPFFAAQAARAQNQPHFAGGSQVIVVAPVPADVDVTRGAAQLPVGPDRTQFTFNAGPGLTILDPAGLRMPSGRLQRGWWIRATGTVGDNPQTVRIDNIQVMGPASEAEQSAFYRRSFPAGYVMAASGSNDVFPAAAEAGGVEPTVLVGRITGDADRARGRLQVQAGPNQWTLEVPDNAAIMGAGGTAASTQNLTQGNWIRAEGWQTGNLAMHAAQIRVIGSAEQFRASEFNRQDSNNGYVSRVAAARLTIQPMHVTGTVAQVNRDRGYFVVRADDGQQHTVYVEEGTHFRRGTDPVGFDALKEGDKVDVTGRMITGGPGPGEGAGAK